MQENNKTSPYPEISSTPTSISEEQAAEMQAENSKEAENKREEREEDEKIEDGLKHVIDTATLKCTLCTNPKGIIKVNYDTPTTQEKKTATVIEKDASSLIFFGNCTKSPNGASPCAAVMQLGQWKDIGTSKSQDEHVLLQKSTIKCNYGGVDIIVIDSGQINEPESLNTEIASLPQKKADDTEYIYYTKDGLYVGGLENSLKVYLSSQVEFDTAKKDKKWSLLNIDSKLLRDKEDAITHAKFIRNASTTYGESSAAYNIIDQYEFFAIASVHKRNKVAYGVNSDFAKKFRALSSPERNKNEAIKYSIAAEINALVGGKDYSNGAKQWDGAEQTHLPATTPDIASNGKFMFKINVMGWDITDEHFASWKSRVSKKFGEKYFNVPAKKYAVENYGGMTNKNKIRLNSSAQYGLTMFWKEVDITKPKTR